MSRYVAHDLLIMIKAASREIIEYEDVMFTGNGAIGKNGKFYVEHPSAVDYIGPPSQIVDDAWHNLTGERDFLITEGEAKELWPDNHETHWHFKKKGYSIGLDLFHTLHCLDSLRRYYYPEYYYGQTELDEDQVTHRGHCINQIRQYIMCAGDMTAYGTRYFKNPGRNYADSDVVHTCRNFGKLREWTRNRYHAGGALKLADVEVWNEWRKDETQY
ncbi:hypothetical protein GQ53DRAFT_816937 [Thozetella sp. PMI_491]|nr:hypothetical protein GQ53DRAFT_816937 [Thozetella sp. PMI_491]